MSATMTETGTLPTDDVSATDDASLQQLMEQLYREQLAAAPGNQYILEHSSRVCIANQIRTFEWYRERLPKTGNILEWGCNHAPDSCLIRAWAGDRLALHSCDFPMPTWFQVFHDFARTQHSPLQHEYELPYPSCVFEAVIASGVLEHACMDYESLKEIRRVLKPGGILAISYLPNCLSLKEWLRRMRRKDFHRRLYGMRETKRLLKRCGFYPVEARYNTFFWQNLVSAVGLGRWKAGTSKVLSCVAPVHVLSSTLSFVAQRVQIM